jgi:nuclear transcription factor Y, gamma
MKSEEFILQELEKEKHQKAAEEVTSAEGERPGVKFMISGEAPVLMSKACELLIRDLSFRAWRHTERNRRRTLQRQDLHAAVGESEVYDFLIDIVPRVTTPKATAPEAGVGAGSSMAAPPLPPGMPLNGIQIPTGLPTGPPQMFGAHVAPPIPTVMDSSMMQQQQQQQLVHHQQHQQHYQEHQQPQQQQTQQQQHYTAFMPMPTMNSDMTHVGIPMVAPGAPTHMHQLTSPVQQWASQATPTDAQGSHQAPG